MPVGKPPIFKTPEAMMEKCEEYFALCHAEGRAPNKFGLCLHLGFRNWSSLAYYAKHDNERYREVVAWVDLMLSDYLASKLCEGKINPTGMIFVSKVCFPDKPVSDRIVWKDKEVDEKSDRVIVVDRTSARIRSSVGSHKAALPSRKCCRCSRSTPTSNSLFSRSTRWKMSSARDGDTATASAAMIVRCLIITRPCAVMVNSSLSEDFRCHGHYVLPTRSSGKGEFPN